MFLCIITLIFSCKRDEEKLGLANNSTNPAVTVIDTFTIKTRTVREDSVATHRLSYYLLGAINSSTFGKSNADVIVNFGLPSVSNFSFPAGSTIDSIFLVLPFASTTSFNGNASYQHTMKAYELTQNIFYDSVYYSTTNFSFNSANIGQQSLKFNLADSVKVNYANGSSETQAPQIRMRLDNAFGTKLVSGLPANFATTQAFQDFIKGIRVNADIFSVPTDDGSIAYLNVFNSAAGLHVFYNDTSYIKFPVTINISATANKYTHDFAGTPIETQLNNPVDYNKTYLQSMSGTKVYVEIPGLDNLLPDDRYAIVGANLTFSADGPSIGPGFDAPTRLLLFAKDTNNTNTIVTDAISDPALYGGNYNSTARQYEFNMPRHLQQIVNTRKNTGLNLNRGFFLRIPSDNPVIASRLVVDTDKGTSRGIKFKLQLIKVR